MCGLVGMAGRLRLSDEKIMKDLLFMDTLRGPHSTGFTQITNFKIDTVRAAVTGYEFIKDVDFTRAINGNLATCWIGHNRWATMGAKTAENAHPFSYGTVTLAHNGTLDRHDNLPEGNSFVVDSRAVANAMDVWGVVNTVRKLDGAFALTWHDNEDDTLNMVRNDERPLFVGVNKEKNIIVWASEKAMLEAACERGKVPLELDRVYQLPIGVHYKWSLAKGTFIADEPVTDTLTLMPEVEKQGKWGAYGYGYGNTTRTNMYQHTSQNLNREKSAGDVLRENGYKVNEIIPVIFNEFEAFTTHHARGNMIGKLQADKDVELQIRFITDSPVKLNTQCKVVFGEVMYVKAMTAYTTWEKSKRQKVVNCISETYFTHEEWEEQEEHKEHAGNGGNKETAPFPVIIQQERIVTDTSIGQTTNTPPTIFKPRPFNIVRGGRTYHTLKTGFVVDNVEYAEMIKGGCFCCEGSLSELEPEDIEWFEHDDPICPACIKDFDLVADEEIV
jgi:predicted glutamine amidotransferase